ncbi:hypothetical protein Taro_025275, partial [Colocasia esculenta]|nr:hypothetical protein [Colocasia esculenta]
LLQPSSRFLGLWWRSGGSEKHVQILEVVLEQESGGDGGGDVGVSSPEGTATGGEATRRLEDLIHGILARRATPEWLSFIPGSSYWVPPRKSYRLVEVLGRAASPLTKEEVMSLTTAQGWPCAAHLFGGYFSGRLAATQEELSWWSCPFLQLGLVDNLRGDGQRPPVPEQVVIGTPGTIKKWISAKKLSMWEMKILVFDKADHLLAEDGFRDDSEQIMREVREAVLATSVNVIKIVTVSGSPSSERTPPLPSGLGLIATVASSSAPTVPTVTAVGASSESPPVVAGHSTHSPDAPVGSMPEDVGSLQEGRGVGILREREKDNIDIDLALLQGVNLSVDQDLALAQAQRGLLKH